jgi:HEAT repeat protein
MTEPRIHRRVVRNRKKGTTPLSKLRASDVVKTVVDHPRRLEELLGMLEEKEAGSRGRAAATLARLAESHPARLLRAVVRLKECLMDESAYVRWNLVYSLGKIGSRFPTHSGLFLRDLAACLDDSNRVVRIIACKALIQVADRKPLIVEELFQNLKREVPLALARSIRSSKTKSRPNQSRTH